MQAPRTCVLEMILIDENDLVMLASPGLRKADLHPERMGAITLVAASIGGSGDL